MAKINKYNSVVDDGCDDNDDDYGDDDDDDGDDDNNNDNDDDDDDNECEVHGWLRSITKAHKLNHDVIYIFK